jgi:hypothetical protein
LAVCEASRWNLSDTEFDQSTGPERAVAAKLDVVGGGVFFIWVGAALLAGASWAVFFLGTGAIMLGAQVARTYLALKVDHFAFVLGIIFVLAGGLRILDFAWEKAAIPVWLVPALFIAVGAAIVLSAWRRKPRT